MLTLIVGGPSIHAGIFQAAMADPEQDDNTRINVVLRASLTWRPFELEREGFVVTVAVSNVGGGELCGPHHRLSRPLWASFLVPPSAVPLLAQQHGALTNASWFSLWKRLFEHRFPRVA